MIIEEKEALARLGSPLNLINRLNGVKRRDAMGLFGVANQNSRQPSNTNNNGDIKPAAFVNPFQNETALTTISPKHPSESLPDNSSELPEPKAPNLDDLVGNADSQVKLGLAHDKALEVLVDSVQMMKLKLDDIKPDKLPSVISATAKVVDQIQRQRLEGQKDKNNRAVHYHFYTPTQKTVEEYEVVDVG